MSGNEWVALRNQLQASIAVLQREIDRTRELVTLPHPSRLRVARPEDVRMGAVFWYRITEAEPYWKVVTEVLWPNDDFKAYVADDGCRYGLLNAWVEQG